MTQNYKKQKAFTLAEILLTLVILGVVSALTVPTLKRNSDEAKYVAAVQKAMAEVASASANVELEYGDIALLWKYTSGDDTDSKNSRNNEAKSISDKYAKTMNVLRMARPNEQWTRYSIASDGKFAGAGGSRNTGGFFVPHFYTTDGMAWNFTDGGYACGGAILIDVNGENPPNVIGIDMHGFRVGQPCSYKKETDSETGKEKIVGTNRTGSFGIYAMGDGINDTNGTWACTSYVIKHKAMPWLYKSTQNGCVDYYAK